MTITIFEDENCRGQSRTVSGNIADLKGQRADKPSSIEMTSASEEVLLFKNDDWHGGVLYLRGPRTVADLGKKDDGGKFGFGNSIRSVRITPFQLDLNVTVVKSEGGDLPGSWSSHAEAESAIEDIVTAANGFYTANRALLRLEIARITFRTSAKHFAISKLESWLLPGEWTERGEVDTIFVDRFTKEGTIGRAMFPCWGQGVLIAAKANATTGPDTEQSHAEMVETMVHEIGHYLGLSHNTSNDNPGNIMFPTASGTYKGPTLRPDQIEEMHEKLSRNISRRGDRN
jgi:Matrixin